MTKDELIAKQQIEIEELQRSNAELIEDRERVHRILYCIGGPLNDNKLQYSKEQLMTFIYIRDTLDL